MCCFRWPFLALMLLAAPAAGQVPKLEAVEVEGQPLAANAERLAKALQFLGSPLPERVASRLHDAIRARDAKQIQAILDPQVLLAVQINPESRVKVGRGPADPLLQQGGYVPVLVKVVNESTVTKALRITSPQAGPIYSGGAAGKVNADKGRFLQVEMFTKEPMTATLSGLKVEYALALIYCHDAGKREATLGFDVGQGTQDLGFRGETAVLFLARPAIPVRLSVQDVDGKPTVGRFTFLDRAGRVFPPRANRLAPDFFFQDQVYRPDSGTVLLPPGEYTMTYGRGPEYKLLRRTVMIPEKGEANIAVKLERWVNAMNYGFYSGDHHIHAAGCQHYTNPTEGVFANDMFLHVKGEGLNVGCNLTWGPCYDFQRQFFEPGIHKLSEPFCVLKYDVEVSGFGSQALGHVCLLNLKDQTYPGSDGTKEKGWPTWTTPLMRWAKAQGAVTGYAHSASGLMFDPPGNATTAAEGIVTWLDSNKDLKLSKDEAARGVLPEEFATLDVNQDGSLTAQEILAGINRVKERLPNYAVPPMNGIGAQEICVTTAEGVCDFISAMDTARVPEWNCWYHLMNCGFPLKASGETDFPCISGSRVGQGRVYVHLGQVDRVDFTAWCEGVRKGRSYVSDGYAHALQFTAGGQRPGEQEVQLPQPGKVKVEAAVTFAAEMPLGTAVGGRLPKEKTRLVELVVNGKVAASKEVPADGKVHALTWEVPIDQSSWVALRHLPQLHTNPVNVLVSGKPVRASRKSALWCLGTIDQLWRIRGEPGQGPRIAAHEREEAHKTFQRAMETYRKIAAECAEGS